MWVCLFEAFLFIALTVIILIEIVPDMRGAFPFPNTVHVTTPLGWIILFGCIVATDFILLIIHAIQVVRHRMHSNYSRSNKPREFSKLLLHHNTNILIYNITLPRILFFIVILPVFLVGVQTTRFYEYLSIYLPLHISFMLHMIFLLPELMRVA